MDAKERNYALGSLLWKQDWGWLKGKGVRMTTDLDFTKLGQIKHIPKGIVTNVL